jgi:alpha-beta hydrolase superfamily lysophospholipase
MLKGVSSGKYPPQVGDYNLVYKTDTTAFYNNGKEIVMAVRGIRKTNPDDRATALATLYNGIPDTKLFKEDERALKKMKTAYPGLPVHGVGHSLGGAIVDSLMDKGLVDTGHSYNPAIQPRHLINPSNHSRTYNEGDILHKLYDYLPVAVPNSQILPGNSIIG